MDPTDLSLFRAAEARLAWIDKRQQVLAQNVANADTPGYQASDIAPFSLALGRATPLAQTEPGHMPGHAAAAGSAASKAAQRAPTGNTVSIEDQLVKVADTASTQALMLNLHRSYAGMMRIAVGRG